MERAHDLEAILKKFFKVTLGLTVVNFEEVTKSRTTLVEYEKSDCLRKNLFFLTLFVALSISL